MTDIYRKMLRNNPDIHKAQHRKSKLGGYPGLSLTALQISEYIPRVKTFIEPFAGLGRISNHVQADRFILNEKSEYALNFLKNNFIAEITNLDFAECMKQYDDKDAFFFIDPPWNSYVYGYNSLAFCDRKPIEYYKEVFELLKTLKGNWMVCSDYWENSIKKMLSRSSYPMKVFTSKKKMFGLHAKTRVISKRPFIKNRLSSNLKT